MTGNSPCAAPAGRVWGAPELRPDEQMLERSTPDTVFSPETL
jgi:hypothetical protein